MNLNMIQRLVKFGLLNTLISKDLSIYNSYIEGKMTNRPFTAKGYGVKE